MKNIKPNLKLKNMKKILFSMMVLVAILLSTNINAQIIDNFEVSKGTFSRGTATAGQTAGITGTTPTLDNTKAKNGTQSLLIYYTDDKLATDVSWYDRFLSNAGTSAAVNLLSSDSKYVGFWMETSTAPAGSKVSILVRSLATPNYYIESVAKEPINSNGVFNLYEWKMDDPTQWGDWLDQNGSVVLGGSLGVLNTPIHINAIIFKAPANSLDWVLNIDDVGASIESRDQTTGINELSINSVKLYPNIVTDEVTLQFNLERNKNINLEIFDYQGRRVYSENMNINSGNSTRKIDMSNYASSLYIAKLKGENFDQSLKIIKK